MSAYILTVIDYFTGRATSTESTVFEDEVEVFESIPPITVPFADFATGDKKQFVRDLTSSIASQNFRINRRRYTYGEVGFQSYIFGNKVTILETLRRTCFADGDTSFLTDFPLSLYKVFHQGAFGNMWDTLNEYINPRTGNPVEGEADFETRKKEIQSEMSPFMVTQGATTYRVNYKVMELFSCTLRVDFDIKSADPDNPNRKHRIKQIKAQGKYDFYAQTITWKFQEVYHDTAASSSGGVPKEDTDK